MEKIILISSHCPSLRACYNSVEHRSVSRESESRKALHEMLLFSSPAALIVRSPQQEIPVSKAPHQDALLFRTRGLAFFSSLSSDFVVLRCESESSLELSLHSLISALSCIKCCVDSCSSDCAMGCNWRIKFTSSGVWTQIVGITKWFCELRLPFNRLQLAFRFKAVSCPLLFIDLSEGQASFWFVFVPNTKLKLKLCLSSLSLFKTLGRLKDLVLRKDESSREELFWKLPNTRGILSVDLPVCRDEENALKHISLSFFSEVRDSILASLIQTIRTDHDAMFIRWSRLSQN